MADLAQLAQARILPPKENADLKSMDGDADRASRNQFRGPSLAKQLVEWLQAKSEVRRALGAVPQGALVVRIPMGSGARDPWILRAEYRRPRHPAGNPLLLVQACETAEESSIIRHPVGRPQGAA